MFVRNFQLFNFLFLFYVTLHISTSISIEYYWVYILSTFSKKSFYCPYWNENKIYPLILNIFVINNIVYHSPMFNTIFNEKLSLIRNKIS